MLDPKLHCGLRTHMNMSMCILMSMSMLMFMPVAMPMTKLLETPRAINEAKLQTPTDFDHTFPIPDTGVPSACKLMGAVF